MAEEDQPVAEAVPTSTAEEAAVANEKSPPPPAEKEGEKVAPPAEEAKPVVDAESNVAGELPEVQKKALEELKALIQKALDKHEFTKPPPPAEKEEKPAPPPVTAVEEAVAEEAEKPEVVTVEETAATETAEKPEVVAVEETAATEATEKPEVVTTAQKPEEVVEEAVMEKAEPPKLEEPALVAVDAKTVEAIEETVVVSAPPEKEPPVPTEPEEASIFGIRLLADSKSDSILLKFLRARDFKAKEAFSMIKSTVWWRKEFGMESLLEEDLGNELGKAVFMKGTDKEGHPVCYNAYGEFQNKELYQSTFSDEEKRERFLKWRIQFLERSIRKLDFSPTGINTIVQVNDLKNSPGPAKRELRQATNQALGLLQDNYPEFVAKQVFINVPWWYLAFNRMISPFLTQRTKSKFVFAGPSKTADTLFKYIAPEQVPVQYGGLSREGEQEFTPADSVTEFTIKPATKHTVELPVSETGVLVWEVRVIGWEVSYGAEFVPSAEDAYTVIVQKARKVAPTDEPVISGSFKVGEPGKVVLTFDNQSSKKKKLLYRSKTKACSE